LTEVEERLQCAPVIIETPRAEFQFVQEIPHVSRRQLANFDVERLRETI
jgi:hypothetical protein